MNKFQDFAIKPRATAFVGDKIKVKNLFDQPIKVLAFKVEPSIKKPGTDYLTVQIEKAGDKRVFFSGSKVLIDQIQQVANENFPFETVIKGDNDRYT